MVYYTEIRKNFDLKVYNVRFNTKFQTVYNIILIVVILFIFNFLRLSLCFLDNNVL